MRPETWASLTAGVLLTVAIVAQGLALYKVRSGPGRWKLLTIGARLGSAIALAASLVLATVAHGEGSPSDLRQVTLGLALATLIIHLLLAWRLRAGSAGPAVDVVVLTFVLVDAIAVRPGGPLLNCAQRAIPYRTQWVLILLGSGGAVVAGSAALTRGLHLWLSGHSRGLGPPSVVDIHTLLRQATVLALLFLGSGIVVSTCWAWLTVGSLADDDPRMGWVAITWLAAAMSELAWRLDKPSPGPDREESSGRWVAALAVVAAAAAILGLLAAVDLRRLLGT